MISLALKAGKEAYGEPIVVYPNTPGSGPMYHVCGRLGIPGISIGGMNHVDTNIHGPNENICVGDYVRGIEFIKSLLADLGARPDQRDSGATVAF